MAGVFMTGIPTSTCRCDLTMTRDYWTDINGYVRTATGRSSCEPEEDTMSEDLNAPRLWPYLGYAPGGYLCNCATCKQQFQGDKRCITCAECAIKRAARVHLDTADHLSSPTPIKSEVAEALRIVDVWYNWIVATSEDMDVPEGEATDGYIRRLDDQRAAITTALAAASVPGKAEGWQPMSSAPKDWSDVLLYVPDLASDFRTVCEGYYDAEERAWCTPMFGGVTPTRWMPLPAAPTGEQP